MSSEDHLYVYIAANKEGGQSYAGITSSLLSMEWIVKYGVDNLVWFEAYLASEAEQYKKLLDEAPEEDRQAIFLPHNPERLDLAPRIWSSDPEDP